jgi:hypothetical protein
MSLIVQVPVDEYQRLTDAQDKAIDALNELVALRSRIEHLTKNAEWVSYVIVPSGARFISEDELNRKLGEIIVGKMGVRP